ncbi:Imm40 family immunity protein [Stenotrophomonas sp. WHRI 8082]|uniref:Imm40 family immunity protein n=1 Tax=Stenotrophomonas sp. WHRI 8082 TaxID=3162571 RepID=UPI0032F089DB
MNVVQYVWSEQIDSMLREGEFLEMLGVRNWALDRVGALDAVERLSCEGIAVAGGDVYRREDGRLETTYENWYCNRKDGEQVSQYIERSVDIARNYISKYPDSDSRVLFSLVPVAL